MCIRDSFQISQNFNIKEEFGVVWRGKLEKLLQFARKSSSSKVQKLVKGLDVMTLEEISGKSVLLSTWGLGGGCSPCGLTFLKVS